MASNGDTQHIFQVSGTPVKGIGSFHKTLPHNDYGEVDPAAFDALVAATEGDGHGFAKVPKGTRPGVAGTAKLTNPQAGLATDRLTAHPASFAMPAAPTVLSTTTAAEFTELLWMAILRDTPFDTFATDRKVATAANEIHGKFALAVAASSDPGHLKTGVDVPGAAGTLSAITPQNIFRLGLPGEEIGPLVSQFFLRDIHYGTQKIDQTQLPYATDCNYLTKFDDWLGAQNSGMDGDGQDYSKANEHAGTFFVKLPRLISTPRDLARFVNKDALHQAYFNATLLLLSGEAKWNPGNPYDVNLTREAGFGVLGGPHILALVSEVATRALKVVWNQKWQVNLRLRPEAYGGLLHVQEIGVGKSAAKRAYGLPKWASETDAAQCVKCMNGTFLLPMAYTPGSPAHPAYGAGHATVAGACVTVLKAYFKTLDCGGEPIKFNTLTERKDPFGDPNSKAKMPPPVNIWMTGVANAKTDEEIGTCTNITGTPCADEMTIEGELNKLAMNVAMGRSIGGVHWRTDNTRSLMLGEAIAAQILADITVDCNENPYFVFRSFARNANGAPKTVSIRNGRVTVDGTLARKHMSAL